MGDESFANRGASTQTGHLGVGPAFIHEHEPGGGFRRQLFVPVRPLFGHVAGWGLYALLLYAVTPLVAAALVIVGLEARQPGAAPRRLMDTADGYLSGAPRERALEIMKDSRVGAMGVFAAIAVMIVKVSALASLARPGAALGLLVGLSAARLLPALDVRYFAYARREGTGAAFAGAGTNQRPGGGRAAASAVVTALAVGALASGGARGTLSLSTWRWR